MLEQNDIAQCLMHLFLLLCINKISIRIMYMYIYIQYKFEKKKSKKFDIELMSISNVEL